MLVEKDMWDLIEIGPKPKLVPFWELKSKKNHMTGRTAIQIIKEGVSNDNFNNIIDIMDLQEM